MPPKKDGKKQAVARPDHSGIPKQDIEFKFIFTIDCQAQQPPNHVIMFQWFGITSDKIQRADTGLIQTWQKTDKKYTYEKSFDLLRIDDDFCKGLASRQFYIYFINADDNKVDDMLHLDYSSLLMGKGEQQQKFTFESSTIKVMDIDSFKVILTANKQLLQDLYRHYLNPFQVQVIGAKDVPIDNSSKYQPTYVKYQFFDGTIVSTNPIVGNGKLVWSHKHVFLSGLMDASQLKQKIRSKYLKFQLHDRDEINKKKIKQDVQLFDITKAIAEQMEKQKPVQEDPKKKGAKKQQKKQAPKKQTKKDTKKKQVKLGQPILPQKIEKLINNYGISAFYLIDFLKGSIKTSKYKSPVVPRNTFQDFESRNIDLNTTARNQMQKIISTNNYFQLDTVLVVGFTISYPIGTFVKPDPKDQPIVQDPKKVKKDSKPAVVEQPHEKPPKESEGPKDIFERVVYIIPYKDTQNIEKIESVFYQTNLNAFSLQNQRQLTTYLLKLQQKLSKSLDYLTGIEIIDLQGRVYIIQGLKQGSMKKLHQIMEKKAPNTKTFKILKNSSILFLERLYADFNIEIKRIRLRPSLAQILLDPNIYIKSKVAQQICQNLNKINELKKLCDDLKTVQAMNLWPIGQWLIQIERKYSQSLSYQDIHGCQSPQKKKKKDAKAIQFKTQKTNQIKFLQNSQLKFVRTAQQLSLPKITQVGLEGTQISQNKKRTVLAKTFTKDTSKSIQVYKMQMKKAQIPINQPVYIYAGQKKQLVLETNQVIEIKNTSRSQKYIYIQQRFFIIIN